MVNEVFGWSWITLGLVSGAFLGMGFDRAGWLGGYDSLRRRLLRLGHISLIALGGLNVLFAISVERAASTSIAYQVASIALIVGAVTMPACCGLMAWRLKYKSPFAVPIIALCLGAVVTATLTIIAGGTS